MGTQAIESLVELREEWEAMQERIVQSSTAITSAMEEIASLVSTKHARLTRQLESKMEYKTPMALPVKIEPVEADSPPGKMQRLSSSSTRVVSGATSSSSTRLAKAMPKARGSLAVAKSEPGMDARDLQ